MIETSLSTNLQSRLLVLENVKIDYPVQEA